MADTTPTPPTPVEPWTGITLDDLGIAAASLGDQDIGAISFGALDLWTITPTGETP